MSFLVPEGRTVRLLETRMTIQPSGDQGEVRYIDLGTNAVGRAPMLADQTMVGKTKQHSFPQRFQEHAFYVASTTIALTPPETLMVTFPSFLIGDRLVDARMMRFHLDRHVQFMAPINC